MANEQCSACGAVIALVGLRHNCITDSRGGDLNRFHLAPKSAAAGTTPAIERSIGATSESGPRETTYRYRDPDKWRAYMRDYMRKKRASK